MASMYLGDGFLEALIGLPLKGTIEGGPVTGFGPCDPSSMVDDGPGRF